MKRRALLKGLAAVAFLPSMAWAGVKRPAVISAFDGSGPRFDVFESDFGQHRVISPRFQRQADEFVEHVLTEADMRKWIIEAMTEGQSTIPCGKFQYEVIKGFADEAR